MELIRNPYDRRACAQADRVLCQGGTMRGQHVVTPQKVADAVATNWRGCNKNVGSHVYSFMRTVIAVAVVGLFACDQGVVNKPKPVAAASVSATPKPAPLMADGPFTAAAWDFVAPLLTGRANK